MMLICQLNRRPVFDADGKMLGRLHELEAEHGKIERIVFGKAGFFERMTGRSAHMKRPWSDVVKIDGTGIHLAKR